MTVAIRTGPHSDPVDLDLEMTAALPVTDSHTGGTYNRNKVIEQLETEL